MKTLIAILAALSLSGCFTMRIENNTKSGYGGRRADEWHHDIVFGLAEISPPVDLSQRCPSGWNWVETQENFVQGLVQAVTLSLYNPKNVEYSCVGKRN